MVRKAKPIKFKVFAILLSYILSTSLTNPTPLNQKGKLKNHMEYFNTVMSFKEKGFNSISYTSIPLTIPFDTSGIYGISSEYGEFRTYPFPRKHKGIDFPGVLNTAILASADGVIVRAGLSIGYGKLVKIKHENNIQTIYAHLNDIIVSIGDSVFAGQEIGKLGNTGNSTGPHLHFETRLNEEKINPFSFYSDSVNISYRDIIERAQTLKKIFNHEHFSN